MQRTWPLAVGTWWAKLIDIFIFCLCPLCRLCGIVIISSKLFHCRLVRTVELDWVTVQYVVNRSETVSGCSLGDGELMKYVSMEKDCVTVCYAVNRSEIVSLIQTKIKCTLDCTYQGVLSRKIIQYFGSSVLSSDIISLDLGP